MTRPVIFVSLALCAGAAAAPQPRACAGSASLGTFRIEVARSNNSVLLPLKSISTVPAGARLVWKPVHLPPRSFASAEIAALLVPGDDKKLIALQPHKASERAEWDIPQSPQVVALIFGPSGLSMGKVKSLVERDQSLLTELADYAEQTSEVESLIQELADSEQSGGGADAALAGFSSRFGVAIPKLDTRANPDQQASVILQALVPAAKAYDPLGSQSAQTQQSAGLAASLAGMFFGNAVGLAAGGTALFSGLKTALFPGVEFRSAFAQTAAKDDLGLCTKNLAAKPHTHIAYLWAYRVPDLKAPTVTIAGPADLPLGAKSTVKLSASEGGTIKQLDRARDWRLVPVAGGAATPVTVSVAGSDSVEIDLAKAKLKPGDYRLDADWDWDPIEISGVLHLRPWGDLSNVHLAPGSRDELIEGSGVVRVELYGGDFEFVERVSLEPAGRGAASSRDVKFELAKGRRVCEQDTLDVSIDTATRGSYKLRFTQGASQTSEIPLNILPPNPSFSNLPVRVNLGEPTRPLVFEGSGLDRIQAVSSTAGIVHGGAFQHSWTGEISLKSGVAKGERYPIAIQVQGLEKPVNIANAIEVVGPRPRITAVRRSLPDDLAVEMRADELPSGGTVGIVISLAALGPAVRPVVELGCEGGELRKALRLSPDDHSSAASLRFAGSDALYLSLDPATVGYPGCRLTAVVETEPEGRSDPYALGRVVRIPHVEQFTLTSEQLGPDTYAGVLKGTDLEMVEKAGWDPQHGLPVDAIPIPVPGDPVKQTLRIVLPWPAPAPHAPLYVWLRGESEGRKTAAAF